MRAPRRSRKLTTELLAPLIRYAAFGSRSLSRPRTHSPNSDYLGPGRSPPTTPSTSPPGIKFGEKTYPELVIRETENVSSKGVVRPPLWILSRDRRGTTVAFRAKI